jgi:hypothetical protein
VALPTIGAIRRSPGRIRLRRLRAPTRRRAGRTPLPAAAMAAAAPLRVRAVAVRLPMRVAVVVELLTVAAVAVATLIAKTRAFLAFPEGPTSSTGWAFCFVRDILGRTHSAQLSLRRRVQ